ncbi:hypothetical protein [Tabrizicola sp.]|uniref:hypothetical protein n=1 Tax=Tabrizicola sp. TaxID=2005166 RepID=UPI0035B43A39
MNRLDPPNYFDDDAALDALALNRRLKCHPQFAAQVPAIKGGYAQYVAASGNAHSVANVALPEPIKAQLKALYASPSKELPHIDRIREQSDANCCPMCGSFHSGTLDHLLPKAVYPVFAIFSRNLVPACMCNSKRTEQVIGAADERILHPYFDDVLRERLFVARFEELGLAPRITLRPLLALGHPQAAAVRFHMTNVVERTSILRYLRTSWTNVLRRPSLAAAELRVTPASRQALADTITTELHRQDDTFGSRNNWRSVFLAGLLDNQTLDWLFAAFEMPGREQDGPLVDGIV